MADENKKFPDGWGSDEDDDDYGFIDDGDEDDEDSAWGNNSPFKKKESVTDSNKNEESDNGQTESYVPAQEVKPSESSAKSAPTVNLSHNPGYIIQKRKISPILIIVIIALVLIIGILGGMLFMSSRNKKESNSRKNSIGSDVEISENEAIETTTKTTKKPITETTTTANTTEKVTETTTAPQHVDTMNAAKKTMYAHLDEQLQIEQSEDISHFDRNPKYAMYDVNGDGIDELFISYLNFESTGSDLYIYNNGEYVKSHEFYTGADICLSEHLLCEKVYGGGEMTKIYVISDNSILQKDEINELYGTDFYHNDFVISEQEYNSLLSKYEALDWIYVPDNSDYISNLIDMSAYEKVAAEKDEFTFFDSVSKVKNGLTDYVLLSETDETSVSGEQQHLIDYDYYSSDDLDIILNLCFVNDRLIAVNFRYESYTYSSTEMFESMKSTFTNDYGQPDYSYDDSAAWYVEPFGPGTHYYLLDYGEGFQLSIFVDYEANADNL